MGAHFSKLGWAVSITSSPVLVAMRGVSKPNVSLKLLEATNVGASFGLLVRINNIVSEWVL